MLSCFLLTTDIKLQTDFFLQHSRHTFLLILGSVGEHSLLNLSTRQTNVKVRAIA